MQLMEISRNVLCTCIQTHSTIYMKTPFLMKAKWSEAKNIITILS